MKHKDQPPGPQTSHLVFSYGLFGINHLHFNLFHFLKAQLTLQQHLIISCTFLGGGDAETKLPSVRFLQQPQLILHSHGGGGGGDQ